MQISTYEPSKQNWNMNENDQIMTLCSRMTNVYDKDRSVVRRINLKKLALRPHFDL